jgi:hypothetical protein
MSRVRFERALITALAGGATAGALALGQACTPVEVPVVADAGSDATPNDGAADAAATAQEQACADWANAFCAKTMCSPSALPQRYPSQMACETIQKQSCLLALEAPGTSQTAALQEACAAAITASIANPTIWACWDFLSTQNPPPACQFQPGALANGAPCAVPQQCQTDYCALVPGAACGTCAPRPPAGTPCSNINCFRGDSCAGTPPTCHTPSSLGLPCGLGNTCVDGLSCVGSTATAMGTCQQAPSMVGDPCQFNGLGCDSYAGVACNLVTGTCEQLRISLAGGACGMVDDQSPTVCAVGICERGVCVPYPMGGEACVVGGPIGCLSPWTCIADGTQDGGAEDGGAQDASVSGTCQLHGATKCN